MVFYRAMGPREAIEILLRRRDQQQQQQRPTATTNNTGQRQVYGHGFKLSVDLHSVLRPQQQVEDGQDIWEEGEAGLELFLLLDQLVTALFQSTHIKELTLFRANLDQYQGTGRISAVIRRLLGTVLPNHPSLTLITFSHCQIAPPQVQLLTSSLGNSDTDTTLSRSPLLKTLIFESTMLQHPRSVAALANNLLRNRGRQTQNIALEKLVLYDCGIESDGCRKLMQALKGNNHLRVLELRKNQIRQLYPQAIQALSSSQLNILGLSNNPLTCQSMVNLTKGLRANWTLEHLRIFVAPGACDDCEVNQTHCLSHLSKNEDNNNIHNNKSTVPLSLLLEELLTTYNFTLRSVAMHSNRQQQQDIQALLRRNEQVRKVHNHLVPSPCHAINDHEIAYYFAHVHLWPTLLAQISNKPTLLYKFMRHGNLDTLLMVSNNNNNKHPSGTASQQRLPRRQEDYLCDNKPNHRNNISLKASRSLQQKPSTSSPPPPPFPSSSSRPNRGSNSCCKKNHPANNNNNNQLLSVSRSPSLLWRHGWRSMSRQLRQQLPNQQAIKQSSSWYSKVWKRNPKKTGREGRDKGLPGGSSRSNNLSRVFHHRWRKTSTTAVPATNSVLPHPKNNGNNGVDLFDETDSFSSCSSSSC